MISVVAPLFNWYVVYPVGTDKSTVVLGQSIVGPFTVITGNTGCGFTMIFALTALVHPLAFVTV
jgi:hypothetical protein